MDRLRVQILQDPDPADAGGAVYVSDSAEPRCLRLDPMTTGTAGEVYDVILDLPGNQSAGWPAEHLFIVGINLEAGHEQDFEDWYNSEHLPALAAVPGVNRAVRFRRMSSQGNGSDAYPAYLALYDITNPDIAGNDDWKEAVETPWTVRLRPHFQAIWRGGYRLKR